MTLSFTDINNIKNRLFVAAFFYAICLLPGGAYAYQKLQVSEDGRIRITSTCSRQSECIVVIRYGGQSVRAWKSRIPEPKAIFHGPDLLELRVTCGSPCFSSRFFSTKYGLSTVFDFVVAVNVDAELVSVAMENSLVVRRIFGTEIVKEIRLNWAPVAATVLAVKEVRFLGEQELAVRYLAGPEYREVEEIIHYR